MAVNFRLGWLPSRAIHDKFSRFPPQFAVGTELGDGERLVTPRGTALRK
jgi:hypothetical protein